MGTIGAHGWSYYDPQWSSIGLWDIRQLVVEDIRVLRLEDHAVAEASRIILRRIVPTPTLKWLSFCLTSAAYASSGWTRQAVSGGRDGEIQYLLILSAVLAVYGWPIPCPSAPRIIIPQNYNDDKNAGGAACWR